MKTVRILHPWMPNYREPFFRCLIDLGKSSQIDYKVYSGKTPRDSSGRNDEQSIGSAWVEVPSRELNLFGRSLIWHTLSGKWHDSDLIIAEHAIRNLILYKWLFWKRPPRLALWGHGKTYTKSNTKLEEILKTKLVNRSDWFFGYTKKGVDSVIEKGFCPRRTTIVQNSTDTNALKKRIAAIQQEAVDAFRSRNTIDNGPVAVFIGALDASKRLDFLIASAVEVHRRIPDFQLLIFGAGPELETALEHSEEFSFIKYCGRADLETQALISKFAKFIMMPGRVGLIAVDSFALGLPIITTKWSLHAPEFEYLADGQNSIICDDNLEDYSLGVIDLIRNESKLNQLKNNCLEDSYKFTIEAMASNFHNGVIRALNEIKPRVNGSQPL